MDKKSSLVDIRVFGCKTGDVIKQKRKKMGAKIPKPIRVMQNKLKKMQDKVRELKYVQNILKIMFNGKYW